MYVKYDEWKKNFTQHFSDKVLNMLFYSQYGNKKNSFQLLSESDAEKKVSCLSSFLNFIPLHRMKNFLCTQTHYNDT